MKKAKKLFLALLCVLIIACIAYIAFTEYSREYSIGNDREQIATSIKKFAKNSSVMDESFDIKQELTLDNKKYILYASNKMFGYAELIRGLNNKYKVYTTECGSGYFRDEIIQTNQGKYLIILSKNYDKKIAYAKIMLDNKEYKIMIPGQEYFIVYCAVPVETKSEYIDINNMKLFDKNNVDITKEELDALIQ